MLALEVLQIQLGHLSARLNLDKLLGDADV